MSETIDRWPAAFQCIFWIIISGTLMVVQLGIVRLIADQVSVFEIVFFRSVFGLIFLLPLLAGNPGILLRPNRWGLCLLCGTLAFVASVCFYFAATYLPLADITAIHFARPIFATIWSKNP